MNEVLIKWTGTKRLQAKHLIQHFPDKIRTYYEPFLGSGAMLYKLMTSNKEVENYVCSDVNEHLVNIWKLVKDDPEALINRYTELRSNSNKTSYTEVRKAFNETKDAATFYYLLRTCRNGLVRFNSKGEFNSAFHHGRLGAAVDKVAETVHHWSKLLNSKKVTLLQRSYVDVKSEVGDFLYIDPPYADPEDGQFYAGSFDYTELWTWLRGQAGSYAMSLDGYQGKQDISLNVPADLYDARHLIPAGFNRLNQEISERDRIYDSLYVKHRAS